MSDETVSENRQAEKVETQMIDVLIRCNDREGNDPIEANGRLPIIPRKGDTLCVWVAEIQSEREEYLDVDMVVLNTWAPERIEVWVSGGDHSDRMLARIFEAIDKDEQP